MVLTLLALTIGDVPGMINPGTPSNVPASYDCEVRRHAYEFGRTTLPRRGEFKTLYDALQLHACGVPVPAKEDAWSPPTYPTPAGRALFVSPGAAAGGDGSVSRPFGEIQQAVDAAAHTAGATILLRAGTHYTDMVTITAAHEGLTIQNYQGERAVVSGGIPIDAPPSEWTKVPLPPPRPREGPLPAGWTLANNSNAVYGRAVAGANSGDIQFVTKARSWAECVDAALGKGSASFNSITWHTPGFNGRPSTFDGECFGVTGTEWDPRGEAGVVSAKGPGAGPPVPPPNVYMLDLSKLPAGAPAAHLDRVLGLRMFGARAVRAKFPNGNPELSGPDAVEVLTYKKGWVTEETSWIKPADRWAETKDDVANGNDWPGVNWPMREEPGASAIESSPQTGEGDWGDFHIGHGGFCSDIDPPAGYWCSQNPPRGNCYDPKTRTSRGCTQTHMSPDGLDYRGVLPNADRYANPKGAVVQAWRCIRWFTNLCLVDSIDKESGVLNFDADVGCNQGGEGCVTFQNWWIENVFEELDEPGEWVRPLSRGGEGGGLTRRGCSSSTRPRRSSSCSSTTVRRRRATRAWWRPGPR